MAEPGQLDISELPITVNSEMNDILNDIEKSRHRLARKASAPNKKTHSVSRKSGIGKLPSHMFTSGNLLSDVASTDNIDGEKSFNAIMGLKEKKSGKSKIAKISQDVRRKEAELKDLRELGADLDEKQLRKSLKNLQSLLS